MGQLMKEDDIYIGGLLEQLNLRFAPPQGTGKELYGGIEEMAAIQKEFQIFKIGRSFRDSAAALGVAAVWSAPLRYKWFRLLEDLKSYGVAGDENDDTRIVRTVIDNLQAKTPLPIFFTAHDSRRSADDKRVLITHGSQPVFYLQQDYITISLPMKPRPSAKAAAKKKK